ncbi:hypothetical protein VZT92_022617 [Zoarces viviparus]|uniref:Uncharacterized protein n=1 Tax=Zoarces viviparus TaxID=48416 RepID=A0AAW1ECN9_ZOAVI
MNQRKRRVKESFLLSVLGSHLQVILTNLQRMSDKGKEALREPTCTGQAVYDSQMFLFALASGLLPDPTAKE